MASMGPTPADLAQLLREWEAAVEHVNDEYRLRLAVLSGSAPPSDEPARAQPEPRTPEAGAPGVIHLPARSTRNRRVLDAVASRSRGTWKWVPVKDIAAIIGPAENVTTTKGEAWQAFMQRTRNSLSALKKTGHLVDRGSGTGEWKLTDAAIAALSVGDTA